MAQENSVPDHAAVGSSVATAQLEALETLTATEADTLNMTKDQLKAAPAFKFSR
jgi:hypothetical protein